VSTQPSVGRLIRFPMERCSIGSAEDEDRPLAPVIELSEHRDPDAEDGPVLDPAA
jgi:hypothetical protein